MQDHTVTVIGEALIDLVPGDSALEFSATPGGSPYNVPSAWPGSGSTRP